jgi:hypothetical protein
MTKNKVMVLLTVLCITATASGIRGGSMPSALALHDLWTFIITPRAGQTIFVGDTIIPRVLVRNLAPAPDSFWLWMRIEHTCSTDNYEDSCWVRLAAGEEAEVRFRPWTPLYPGTYRAQSTWLRNDTLWLYFPVLGAGIEERSTPDASRNTLEPRPNPARGIAQVSCPLGVTAIRVYDASGRLVRTLAPREGRATLSGLGSGVYLLKAESVVRCPASVGSRVTGHGPRASELAARLVVHQ